MKLEPRHERPLQLLHAAEAAVPGCWEWLDQMRSDRGRGLPEWPTWCYLPIAAGMAVATDGAPIEQLGYRARLDGAQLGPKLVALSAWRTTQGIWDYDPDLYRELWETPIEGRLPVELLYRLPEWAPYICLREELRAEATGRDRVVLPGDTYLPPRGVIPWLEWDANRGPAELRMLIAIEGAPLTSLPCYSLHLDADTVDECMHRAADEAIRQAAPHQPLEMLARIRVVYGQQTDMVGRLLSLVLYLCSQEPDLTRRLPPAPSSYRKPVLRPPQQPTVWPVGLRIGAALRAAAAEHAEPGDPTGRQVRAHMRRAHWHCYWTGSRSEGHPGDRLELRWVAPVAVGAGEAVAVVRPVK